MRTKDILLKGFEDIKILQQYLYVDESHVIQVENTIGVLLEISMNDKCRYLSRNMNYPDFPPMDFTSSMDIDTMLGIIEQLKEQESKEFPQTFKNRWEEIKTMTQGILALNADI